MFIPIALGTAGGAAGRGDDVRAAGFRDGARLGAERFLAALFFLDADFRVADFRVADFREAFFRAGMEPSMFRSYRRLPERTPAGAAARRSRASKPPNRTDHAASRRKGARPAARSLGRRRAPLKINFNQRVEFAAIRRLASLSLRLCRGRDRALDGSAERFETGLGPLGEVQTQRRFSA